MNIALIGYGKMGKAIEAIAVERGHSVSIKIDLDNSSDFNEAHLRSVDVAIEFTSPHTALHNVLQCIDWGVPVVCGSTGWLESLPQVESRCSEKNGSFLYASNFSVGVNIFFEVNKHLTRIMSQHPQYTPEIKEIHHTQKKDAPSGTAITLAEQLIASHPSITSWTHEATAGAHSVVIHSDRIDPYPGWHEVKYRSEVDEITIVHNAKNRQGFALGAVLAAEFIQNKRGIFTMKDVLGFGN
ncbi:MAG: 4-hydroxy-tetrahydrodipicolinate reductase [Bacteroidetes bacterium]|nr:4-hydroxy-tetrahydrodipicolinate reductase [Bacteroidota bacterium]